MTSTVWALGVLAAVAAAVDWWAVASGRRPVEYVAKPATLALLIGAALVLDPADSTQRAWFVAALVLSLAGDVFLMLPSDAFVPGLASFLLGHVAYVIGFAHHGATLAGSAVAALIVAGLASPVVLRIVGAVRRADASLLGPVLAYMTVITVMVGSALSGGGALAAAGAVVFMASDSMIAWNRFVTPFRGARVAIIVTYHLAQTALVVSLL